MLIEFVGLPGSGKSTVCRALDGRVAGGQAMIAATSASFGETSTSHLPFLRRKSVAARRIVRSFLSYPRASWLFLCYGLSSRPLTAWKIEQTLSGISFFPRLAAEQASPRRGAEVLLFEQGIVQLLGSLALPGGGSPTPDPAVLVGAALPGLIDGLVWLDCPPEDALNRVRSRSHGRSRFDAWTDGQAMSQLPVMQAVLERAVAAAGDSGLPVLRLDSAASLETNCAAVSAWIARLWGDR